MQRRKFLIGMGSLAAGGAAATGTGAVTSVTANRQVAVEVAGDSEAYLGLSKPETENGNGYVVENDGEIAIDFDGNNNVDSNPTDTPAGNGFNPNAVTVVDRLLEVANQGTQSVYFHVDFDNLDLTDNNEGRARVALEPVDLDGSGERVGTATDNDGDEITSVTKNANAEEINAGDFDDGTFSGVDVDNNIKPVEINQGDAIELDLIVDTRNFDPSVDFPLSTSGTVQFIADQTSSM